MLETLANKNSDVKVRKVDINRAGYQGIDFQSPVAHQYIQNGIPFFVLYDENGTLVGSGDAAFQALVRVCVRSGLTEDYLRQQGVIR